MKKKIVALVAAFATLFSATGIFAGCGDPAGSSDSGSDITSSVSSGSASDDESSSASSVEASAPVISLAYESVVIGKGDAYDLLDGVEVSDEYDTDIEVSVRSDGGFDKDTTGTYTVTYESTNSKGKTGTATRTVTVADVTAPTLGWVRSGSVNIALPELEAALSDSEITVEYKAEAAETYTAVEKTADGYVAELSDGAYDVRYNVKKDKLDKTVTAKLNVYTVTMPDDVVLPEGDALILTPPQVSENVDGTVAYSYKAAGSEGGFGAVAPDPSDGVYKLWLDEGTYTIRYEISLTETETASYTYTATVIKAGLADKSVQIVEKAGTVQLRTPEISDGVTYAVSVREALPDAETFVPDAEDGVYSLNVAMGSAYTVSYVYTYAGEEVASDSYYVYAPQAGVFDFEDKGGEYPYGAGVKYADNDETSVSDEYALSGSGSFRIHFYTMGNWFGYKNLNYTVGENVNAVSFFVYSDSDFTSTLQLWMVTDTNGSLYSNDTVVIKAGLNKYTLHFNTAFNTVKTYTFNLKTQEETDKNKIVYIDDMYFFADTQS